MLVLAGGLLAGAVLVGPVQGHVPHAVHRLRPLPAAVADGHVAHDALHDQWGHVLRNVPRPRHKPHPESRFLQETVQREGAFAVCNLYEYIGRVS